MRRAQGGGTDAEILCQGGPPGPIPFVFWRTSWTHSFFTVFSLCKVTRETTLFFFGSKHVLLYHKERKYFLVEKMRKAHVSQKKKDSLVTLHRKYTGALTFENFPLAPSLSVSFFSLARSLALCPWHHQRVRELQTKKAAYAPAAQGTHSQKYSLSWLCIYIYTHI